MQNKYIINQKVICRNLKCLIIANKLEPYKQNIGNFLITDKLPQNDYLLFILKDIINEEYFGTLDVMESEIQDTKW